MSFNFGTYVKKYRFYVFTDDYVMKFKTVLGVVLKFIVVFTLLEKKFLSIAINILKRIIQK